MPAVAENNVVNINVKPAPTHHLKSWPRFEPELFELDRINSALDSSQKFFESLREKSLEVCSPNVIVPDCSLSLLEPTWGTSLLKQMFSFPSGFPFDTLNNMIKK